MSAHAIGAPCPKCGALLMPRERARLFRNGVGDVAFCARCKAAWDIAEADELRMETKPAGPMPVLG